MIKNLFSGEKYILFDGGMGTMLQANGIQPGECPERWNITHPEIIEAVHRQYVEAGADFVSANTFGANSHKLPADLNTRDVIMAAVKLARASGARFVAQDIGPTGVLLKPLGTMEFDEAYELFKEQVIAGEEAGTDVYIIETMTDLLETKAAVLAVKENSEKPVIASMSFGEDGRTFLGNEPANAAITLCGLGVDAVGVNCSLGPEQLIPIVEEFCRYSTVPVIVQANAGLPEIKDGKTVFNITPEEYCRHIEKILGLGVCILGGCCGTTPEYIRGIKKLIEGRTPVKRNVTTPAAVTSAQRTVFINNGVAVIGERLNPTGKKKISQALRDKNYDLLVDEALSQMEAGAEILDVNAGLPDINEKEILSSLIGNIQAVCPLPLQIDTSDPEALELAVRHYCGKPIINSVNGEEESLNRILPIVKKYGAAVICLTLDENGIPKTAEERVKIAEKIMNRALLLGIPKENLIIDTLVLTASTNQDVALETLKAVRLVKERLGLATALGVSNISFGLPNREIMNSVFLAAALNSGLNLPIIDPTKERYMQTVVSYKVLNSQDAGSEKYISYMLEHPLNMQVSQTTGANGANAGDAGKSAEDAKGHERTENKAAGADGMSIKEMVISGRKATIDEAVIKLLETKTAMEIINEEFIPALDKVGELYESGRIFLPQLMSAAEAAKKGFDAIKSQSSAGQVQSKLKILLATVKGDIHDIGKNIVKMLLENYGYFVIDLGRDVDPELVAEKVMSENIKLVGLSALMTTTVKSMEDTIKALKAAGADCKVMVGGAVLNSRYAEMVGADYYAKDAAEAARIAALVEKELSATTA